MALAYFTYCSKDKNASASELSALDRYVSERIAHVHELSRTDKADFFILSGQFGVLRAQEKIPNYDHLLLQSEVEAMTARVEDQLRNLGLKSIRFFTADPNVQMAVKPYGLVMKQACLNLNIELTETILDPPYID